MTISQTITVYADDVPNKDTMTADEFDTAANDWVDYWTNTVPSEINTWASEANALKTDVNNAEAAALAAANFKGNWSSLSGALNMPASVYHSSKFWMLMEDLEDVEQSEPSSANSDWQEMYSYEDVVISTDITHFKVVSEYPAEPENDVMYFLYTP